MGTQKCFGQKPLSDAPDTAPPHQKHHCFPFHPYISHTVCCLEKTPALWLAQYTKGNLPALQFHVNFDAMAVYCILLYEQFIYSWPYKDLYLHHPTSSTYRVCFLNRPSLALAASRVAVKDSFVCLVLLTMCPQWTLTLSHQTRCAGTVNTTRGRAKGVMIMRMMHKGNSTCI